jgi:hypothetical protein
MDRRFRSAISGRWVSRLFARSNPDTTVSESTGTIHEVSTEDGSDERPGTMQCQYCARWTSKGASICEWCGSELEEGE